MNIQRIVVPVDFSSCSMGVVRDAASLAARVGAHLHILHVGDLPPGITTKTKISPDGHAESAGDFLVRDAEKRMAPFAEAARHEGISAETIATFGPIAKTILSVTQSIGADLIIMGTHGRSGLARLVLGSVAEQVVHSAMVPVMLIRRQPRPECGRAECDWCTEGGRSRAEQLVDAERQG